MGSRASILGHPIHPMIIPFPIALWIFSLAADVIFLFGWGGPVWTDIAFYTMLGGVLGGLVAAIPGYLDYRTIVEPAVASIARWHMLLNLSLVTLFIINLWMRATLVGGAFVPVVLSVIGVGLLGVSGWLGGELVYVHGVAVEPQPTTESRRRGRLAS
ncbi:MAG TPA: DUF2231 domain-containing protein [Nitrospirales bacterium]|nr:DUF2231 domain-containing protein [Nitrospirales bacterium]